MRITELAVIATVVCLIVGPAGAAQVGMPQSEKTIILTLAQYAERYSIERNDLTAVPQIKERFNRLQQINSNCCQDWVGTVLKIELRNDGGLGLLVGLSGYYSLANFTENIAKDSALYSRIAELRRGSEIRFAGHLVLHPEARPQSLAGHYIDFAFDDVRDVTPADVEIVEDPRGPAYIQRPSAEIRKQFEAPHDPRYDMARP